MKAIMNIILIFLSCILNVQANSKYITNSIGIKFVLIPAGSFYMGSCSIKKTTLSRGEKEENRKRAFMGNSNKISDSNGFFGQ